MFGGMAVASAGNSICIEEMSAKGPNALDIFGNTERANSFRAIEEDNSILIGATYQSVYVKETLDNNGNVTDSRLMTVSEVAKAKKEANRGLVLFDSIHQGITPNHPKQYKTTLSIVVYQDTDTNNYIVYGTADWDPFLGPWVEGESSPARGLDFMGLTWGGNGEFKCPSSNAWFSAKYLNGNNIPYTTPIANGYSGYCWGFEETTSGFLGVGASPMTSGTSRVILEKTYSTYQNLETNVIFTYIHTWQAFSISPSIGVGLFGPSINLNLSTVPKQWNQQLNIIGLLY